MPKQTKLDYSVLGLPITATDIKALETRLKAETGSGTLRSARLWMIFILALCFLPVLIALGFAWSQDRSLLVLCIIVVVLAVAVFYVRDVLFVKPRMLVKLYRFADINRLQVIRSVSDPGYSGMIFDEGHSRQVCEALRFPNGVEIGNYQYVTGSGKHRQTHDYAYAKLPLGRHLPHMVLDSLQNNFLGMTNLPDSFKEDQRLELEGDFNKHFKLYAPKQYERDALYIFTPDVMATMIDNGERYDMEIVDDTLYIYSQLPIDLLSPQRLEPLIEVADKIGQDLTKQTTRYSDERVGDRQQDIVAAPGQRLKKGVNWVIALIVIGVIGLQVASSFWPEAAVVGWAVIWLCVVCFIIFSVIRQLKSGFSK